MSSLNDSDEQTSFSELGSRAVDVATSHFSKINSSNGNRGCLKSKQSPIRVLVWHTVVLKHLQQKALDEKKIQSLPYGVSCSG